jgi:hypothetical protein
MTEISTRCRRVVVWTLILAGWSIGAAAQPDPNRLWTNSAITNWITAVNKNTGAVVREWAGRTGLGNGLGITVVGNTVFYTIRDKNVYMLDATTGAELGVAFSVPQAVALSTVAFDGRNFWLGEYAESKRAFYVSPTGTVLKTITLSRCFEHCDGLEYFEGKLIANRYDEPAPAIYDIYDTNGNLLREAFITTDTVPGDQRGRGITWDGSFFYVASSERVFVYSAVTGALVRVMSPGGLFREFEDLAIEYAPAQAVTAPTRSDFDGDGKADIASFQPGNSDWHILNSGANFTTDTMRNWGAVGDIPTPGDYDGDGKGDIAVYRPSTGIWYVLLSSSGGTSYTSYFWGNSTDLPVPADYDGDGRTDIAVFRPSTGVWWQLLSTTNYSGYVARPWGNSTDVPVPRDFDGDGKADVAVFRPSTGDWYVLYSSTNSTGYVSYRWGQAGDTPVAADYDGDGKTDIGIYRPSSGRWWLLLSTSNYSSYLSPQWGVGGDIPVPADYDGDGKADVAVYRPATGVWHIVQSANGVWVAH